MAAEVEKQRFRNYDEECHDDDDVRSQDSLLEKPTPTPRNRPIRRLLLPILLALLLFALALTAVATQLPQHPTPPPQPLYTSCGSTPSEARARDCHFDTLSFAWQTAECYDAETSTSFLHHNNKSWTYYTALGGAEERSEADALKGEQETWVTGEYHFVHCTYMWRQLHRAYQERGYVDAHLDNWNHTKHCQKALLREWTEEEWGRVNVRGKVIYPVCRRIW